MPQNEPIRLSFARGAGRSREHLPLFRQEAVRAAREPLHGTVTVVMPPSASVAAGISLIALALLGLAAFVVEVPQRARAIGVLMPPQGFMKIVAIEAGQVLDVNVREGEQVVAGRPLLNLGSDRIAAHRGPLSASQIRSLQGEQRLLQSAHRERQRIQSNRIRAVNEQIGSIDRRLEFVAEETGIQHARSAVLQSRLDRLDGLASKGNIPAVQLDDAKLEHLQAESAAAVLKRQAAQIEAEREQLVRARASLAEESELQQIEFAIADEQLQRQVAALEPVVSRHLQAPQAGVVARVNIRPGQVVRAGQTLMTLHPIDAALQAWLYLPSANAGFLRPGQEVELRLDAYPHQMFGTQSATIASISSLAFLPSELDVPLALGGPVFEVRATLERQFVRGFGTDWPLNAGTAFQADLVQQRYRLYEWLLRLRRRDAAQPGSPADA